MTPHVEMCCACVNRYEHSAGGGGGPPLWATTGLSIITNMVVTDFDSEQKTNHAEVLETTRMRTEVIQRLVTKIVAKIQQEEVNAGR